MAIAIWICFACFVTATAISDSDEVDSETNVKPNIQNARHLKYDGDFVLQPDENVISVDRVRALLRNGYSSVRLGNRTLASANSRKVHKNATTTPRLRSTTITPKKSSEDSDYSSEEGASIVTDKSIGTSRRPVSKNGDRLTTTVPALITESSEDSDEEVTARTLGKKSKIRPTTTIGLISDTPDDEEHSSTETASQMQVLQAQFKRIQSAMAHTDPNEQVSSIQITPLPTVPPSSTFLITAPQPLATENILSQLFRNFASFVSHTPPPSPFLSEHQTDRPVFLQAEASTASAILQPVNPISAIQTENPTSATETTVITSTSTSTPRTEGTIPFAETTTTTTEAPMPPPVPDYVVASKQLTPFVSGVKVLDSGSTRDALDAASQMGKLTWLVNYYETASQQQINRKR